MFKTAGQYIYQSNTFIGIGQSNPINTIDINGSMTLKSMTLCNSWGWNTLYTSNNCFGIGYSNPFSTLDINGDLIQRGGIMFSNNTGCNFLFQSNGCLGINTSNPIRTLTLNGNFFTYGDITLCNYISKTTIGTDEFGLVLPNNSIPNNALKGVLSQWTANKGTIFIFSSNFGIGTVNPSNALTVVGSASIGYMYSNLAGPTNSLIVQSAIGIGTSSPSANLDVSGNAIIRGSLTFSNITGAVTLSNSGGGIDFGPQSILGTSVILNTLPGFTFNSSNMFMYNCNVGLNTSNPSSTLEIVGTTTIASNLVMSNAVSSFTVSSYNNNLLIPGPVGINTNTPSSMLDVNGTSIFRNYICMSNTYGSNTFYTSNNYIGIGNSNPIATLDINGTLNISSNVTIGGILTVNNVEYITSNIRIYNSEIVNSNLTIYNNISVSNANISQLYIPTNNTGQVILGNVSISNSINTNFALYQGPSGDTVLNSALAQPLEFKIGNIEYIRLTPTGYVGIGITNPQTILDVNGSATVRGYISLSYIFL